jgi:enoyl-CoA hydratase/carnithine racemase
VSVAVADAVGTIRLDDPDTRNALSNETLREIAEAFVAFDAAADVRLVVTASQPAGQRCRGSGAS